MRTFLHPFPPLLKAWVWSFLVCGVISLIIVGQITWAMSWSANQAWQMVLRDWLPWAVVAPLLWRLVERLPLERPNWRLGIPVHVLIGILVIGINSWWAEVVVPPPNHDKTEAGSKPSPAESRRWIFPLLFFRMPVYLALISIAHSFHFYRRSVTRGQSLSQARLAALKMQLQPHFLFNSLNAIAALVHSDPDTADEMIAALSSLLRLSLDTSGDQLLPLAQELEFVRRYLDIEHIRFGDRLGFTLDIPAETQAALVPAFLLQPLVENAVRHGLEPRAGKGSLNVSASREGAELRLRVEDNGIGLPETAPLREGIGLANTRARLAELFQGAASLELRSGEGLTVLVTLPFRTATS